MLRAAAGLAFALTVSACDRGAEPQPTPLPPTPEPISAGAPRPSPEPAVLVQPPRTAFLTPDGYGPVRIGMTEAEAARALGEGVQGVTGAKDDCHFLLTQAPPAPIIYMIEQGRVTRVTAHHTATATTQRGVGVGATEAQVRQAYGGNLQEEPHKYVDAPAKYLTVWTRPNERGLRFEISEAGVVSDIHVGDATIQYVEGCS